MPVSKGSFRQRASLCSFSLAMIIQASRLTTEPLDVGLILHIFLQLLWLSPSTFVLYSRCILALGDMDSSLNVHYSAINYKLCVMEPNILLPELDVSKKKSLAHHIKCPWMLLCKIYYMDTAKFQSATLHCLLWCNGCPEPAWHGSCEAEKEVQVCTLLVVSCWGRHCCCPHFPRMNSTDRRKVREGEQREVLSLLSSLLLG